MHTTFVHNKIQIHHLGPILRKTRAIIIERFEFRLADEQEFKNTSIIQQMKLHMKKCHYHFDLSMSMR